MEKTLKKIVDAAFAHIVGAAFLPPLKKVVRPFRGGRNAAPTVAAPTVAAPTALLLALTIGLAGAAQAAANMV